MKKFKSIFSVVSVVLILLPSQLLFAQFCAPDPDDIGKRDTLFITGCYPERCIPGTEITITVWAKFDEVIEGIAIPLKYKTTQTDIFLDSLKLIDNGGASFSEDTVINRTNGTINYFALGPTGGTIPPGTDTFMIIYFRTGTTTWDPNISTPIETTTIGGQGLSFVDTAVHDIQPCIFPYGWGGPCICSEVKDDHSFPSTLRPVNFSLSQNFPNPFNNETVITFALPHFSNVKIEIFNILGQKVRDLVDEKVSAGYKKVVWDGRDDRGKPVASGVYFYRIRANDLVDVKKMTLLK